MFCNFLLFLQVTLLNTEFPFLLDRPVTTMAFAPDQASVLVTAHGTSDPDPEEDTDDELLSKSRRTKIGGSKSESEMYELKTKLRKKELAKLLRSRKTREKDSDSDSDEPTQKKKKAPKVTKKEKKQKDRSPNEKGTEAKKRSKEFDAFNPLHDLATSDEESKKKRLTPKSERQLADAERNLKRSKSKLPRVEANSDSSEYERAVEQRKGKGNWVT